MEKKNNRTVVEIKADIAKWNDKIHWAGVYGLDDLSARWSKQHLEPLEEELAASARGEAVEDLVEAIS